MSLCSKCSKRHGSKAACIWPVKMCSKCKTRHMIGGNTPCPPSSRIRRSSSLRREGSEAASSQRSSVEIDHKVKNVANKARDTASAAKEKSKDAAKAAAKGSAKAVGKGVVRTFVVGGWGGKCQFCKKPQSKHKNNNCP